MIARVAEVVSGIGPKIKSLRKQNGYSLQSLAERADVSAATIHKIEQSDMVPTITTLLKIAGAFELPVSYFVEDDDDHLPTVHTRAANRRPIYTSHAGLDGAAPAAVKPCVSSLETHGFRRAGDVRRSPTRRRTWRAGRERAVRRCGPAGSGRLDVVAAVAQVRRYLPWSCLP
ncbi:helix-turn-helix domain-containing protein [Nonomuraea sp. C10]|uniref:helix-turn-helix domain-containing protein n=1 Tax=Nonomuraea sp. C10 TaxID=2600577 RepID=UPI0011CDAFD4|nr:helix-turn-helix transcriptional regulator [Nonomuraea sp. C10]TXK36536.1 helix-turn-helix transcriptional regulator [Nonomuraea sp. C10]